MRPLNRPMFKNGGPIKEGIMSGMKDSPQQLVQPNADGSRPGYAGPFTPLAFLAPLATRLGLTRIGQSLAGQGAKKIAQTTPASTTGGGTGGFFKNIFFTQKQAPFTPIKIGQSKGGKILGLKPKVVRGGSGPDKKEIAQVSELRPYFANDPSIALMRGTFNALTNPEAKGLFAKGARFVLSPTGVITGGYFFGGKFFDGDGNEISDDKVKELGLTAGDKVDEKVITGESDSGQRKLTRDEQIEANRKRYYGLMGVDKMNKEAVYDTLIDASNQIREGGNIKDQLKSGSLATGVINALSKNLDKSVDLKRQIDAAILKSEITKDIKASDPAERNKAKLVEKQLALADQKLAGPTLDETAAEFQKNAIPFTGQALYAAADRAGVENLSGIFDTDTVQDFLEDNTTKTEADFFNQEQEKRVRAGKDPFPPGNYIVGGRIVSVGTGGLVTDFVY